VLDGGAVVKELCCAVNGDSPQIRREGDDANAIFWWEGFRVFRGGHGTRLIPKYRRCQCVHRV
jgi:hypothetical protein